MGEGRAEGLYNGRANEGTGVEDKRGSVCWGSLLMVKNKVEIETGGELEGKVMVEEADDCTASSALVTGVMTSTKVRSEGDLLPNFILSGPLLFMLNNLVSLFFSIV